MAVQLSVHSPQAAEEETKECHVTFCRSALKTSLKLHFSYLQKGFNHCDHFPSRMIAVRGRWHYCFGDLLHLHLYPRAVTISCHLFLQDYFYNLRFERRLKQIGNFGVQSASHYAMEPTG